MKWRYLSLLSYFTKFWRITEFGILVLSIYFFMLCSMCNGRNDAQCGIHKNKFSNLRNPFSY